MRKIKSERNTKKLKNSVDDFYYCWINHPALKERIKTLSNKKMNQITDRLKFIVDRMYLRLRVEEKFMYYINLYNLYEMITIYFQRKNKVIETLEKITDDVCITERIKEKKDLDIIKEFIGYETAFIDIYYKKADDTAHWLYSCIMEILKKYIGRLKDDRTDVLNKKLSELINEIPNEILVKEKNIQKEIEFLNEILKRIKYARENIDVIFSFWSEKDDKKLRTMIKGSLTRTEKLINMVVAEIEDACMVA